MQGKNQTVLYPLFTIYPLYYHMSASVKNIKHYKGIKNCITILSLFVHVTYLFHYTRIFRPLLKKYIIITNKKIREAVKKAQRP